MASSSEAIRNKIQMNKANKELLELIDQGKTHKVLKRAIEHEEKLRHRMLADYRLLAQLCNSKDISAVSGHELQRMVLRRLESDFKAYEELDLSSFSYDDVSFALKTQKMSTAEDPKYAILPSAIRMVNESRGQFIFDLYQGILPYFVTSALSQPKMLGKSNSEMSYFSALAISSSLADTSCSVGDIVFEHQPNVVSFWLDSSSICHANSLPGNVQLNSPSFSYNHDSLGYAAYVHSGYAFGGKSGLARDSSTTTNPYAPHDCSSFVSWATETPRLSTIHQYGYYASVTGSYQAPESWSTEVTALQNSFTCYDPGTTEPEMGDVIVWRRFPENCTNPLGRGGHTFIYLGKQSTPAGDLFSIEDNRLMPDNEGIGYYSRSANFLQSAGMKFAILRPKLDTTEFREQQTEMLRLYDLQRRTFTEIPHLENDGLDNSLQLTIKPGARI